MQGMGFGEWRQALSPLHQVAAILTLPFDVVKTQRQVALGAVEAVRGKVLASVGPGGRGGPSGVLLGHASHLQ